MEQTTELLTTIMQVNISSHPNTTLADILLDVMEHTGTPELKRLVSQVRIIMQLPECVEMFNTIISNSVGARMPISEDTIHKAVDCLIRIHTQEIENSNLNSQNKQRQIALMTAWEKYCEQLIITDFYQQGLLIQMNK